MTLPKLLLVMTIVLFGAIGLVYVMKGEKKESDLKIVEAAPFEIELDKEVQLLAEELPLPKTTKESQDFFSDEKVAERRTQCQPEVDRINELFNIVEPKLPIVETIVYHSRVDWQKGRPAWLSDYANYYKTSRHFIARSLNGKPDYLKQDVAEGDRFNVFRKDSNFTFHLVIDLSRCKLWMYYVPAETKEPVLLKTYQVGLGRIDDTKTSGLLTPLGTYTLGSKIAIYKPKMTGIYNGGQVEMINIFGTRWIPFDKEVRGCTAPAKGFGIHGLPCTLNEKGVLVEDLGSLGRYQSDGCIRLSSQDIEEIFAIVITRPVTIELVKDYCDSQIQHK